MKEKYNDEEKIIRKPKSEKNTRYTGEKGLKNRFISLVLATVIGMGATAVALENYEDEQERLIATVQDVKGDKFDNSAPIKIDFKDRKKVVTANLIDGKYYEVTANSIVLVKEDKIKSGDKKMMY